MRQIDLISDLVSLSTPTAEIEITENGIVDVKNYATANIDVMLYVDENSEVE